MLKLLLLALRRHHWLAYMGGGFVLSSVGSGLTFVIVFGHLLRLQAPASSLALAYVLSSAPGILGSTLAEKTGAYGSPFFVLLAGELLGLLGLSLPVYGVLHDSIPALLLAECATAFSMGMTFPAISLICKRGLADAELPAATSLETLVFASNVVFGVGGGVLLYGRLDPVHILAIDAASFVAAAVLIVFARRVFDGTHSAAASQPVRRLPWRGLSADQRRGLLLQPVLGLVGAPAMALLPALAPSLGQPGQAGLALPLLFARSLGQLLGPFLLSPERVGESDRSNRLIFSCLGGFVGCYALLPFSGYFLVALMLIFAAHILSNIVFALAINSVLINFDEAQVSLASAKAYRLQMIVSLWAPLGAGLLADETSASFALYCFSGVGFAIAGMVLLWSRNKSAEPLPGRT